MALLFILALFIAVWKRAIAVSDKLRPRTWELLTFLSLVFFIVSLYGSAFLIGSQVIPKPPTASLNPPPEPNPPSNSGDSRNPLRLIPLQQGVTPDVNNGAGIQVHGSRDRAFNFSFSTERAQAASLTHNLPGFRKFFERTPTRIDQVTPPEHGDPKKDLLFWIALFGMIVSPITSIATAVLTWIALHRKRAEEILLRLELDKRRLEIRHLQLELKRAEDEYDKSKTVPSKIVILS